MEWEKLLSLKRFGDTFKRKRIDQDETRLGFEVDYDRIIFSSEFRSLQDKTQVVPFSQGDFVHTRLTHSLETSVVGRSLGRSVGVEILKKHPYLKDEFGYQSNDFGAIVASASLAHDIGNPPFGHSGEKSIGQYFISGRGKQFQQILNEKEFKDLCDFEGNANGFKILTQSRPGREGGIRLSYATLGTFVKYPKESLPVKPTSNVANKKYGFFQNEKETFIDIANELGLKNKNGGYNRHPLTFLVEAADDICYTIIDFEDGINLGLIQEDYALEYLINLVRDSINTEKYNSLNKTSIGIEIQNSGHDYSYENFSSKQIDSLKKLLKNLVKNYKIDQKNILGHSDIAPNRKKDPGEKFPWQVLAKYRLAWWHKLDLKKIKRYRKVKLSSKKEESNFLKNLHKVGYMKNNHKKSYKKNNLLIIKAFQRRFRQDLINGKIDKECLLISKSLLIS